MGENAVIDGSVADEMRSTLETDDLPSAVGRIKEYLEQQDRVEINIAVTGESGSGKSTFINAFRDIGHEEEDSAKTDVVQTTNIATAYSHPNYPNVKLWDLPGIGTPKFKADEYLKQVEICSYDFFIIIAAGRFREYHVQLAEEIVKINKKFYFVRSQIDANMYSEQKTKKNFDKEKTLKKIRADCISGLKETGLSNPSVFLISSFDLAQYDFNRLEETMERELPQHKKHVLMLALPNISLEVNDRKKKALHSNIWKLALISASVAALPIPILNATASISVDVTILVVELQRYYKAFGLDPKSLKRLSERSGRPVDELQSKLKSPLNREINKDVIINLLRSSAFALEAAAEYWLGLIPIVGSLASGSLSFATVYYILHKCLNELAEDAKNVLMAALETSV